MNRTIVFHEGDIVIRYPKISDAKLMCDYINTISKEKTYITLQGEKVSFKEEKEYVSGQVKKIKERKTVQLLLFVNNKLSGISSVDLGKRIQKHVGNFGISISKEQRGKGLGKLLTKLVLEEATKIIKNLKIVTLAVFTENKKAIRLYTKFGFKKYGLLPKGNKYKGKFVDDVLMYKEI